MENVLCVLVVHFNNAPEVTSFTQHVRSLVVPEGWRVDIVICDNSRNWQAADQPSDCAVVVPTENLGYLNGCAFALEHWRRIHGGSWPDIAAVTNTDLSFSDHSVEQVIHAGMDPAVAVVAPDIRTPSGLAQNPFMVSRPSRLRIYLLARAFSGIGKKIIDLAVQTPAYRWWQRRKASSPSATQVAHDATDIYAAHGSAMFLTRRYFETGCSLSLPWHMLGEEVFVAEQVQRAGLKVRWVRSAHVLHQVSSTIGHTDRRNVINWRAEALNGLWQLYFK